MNTKSVIFLIVIAIVFVAVLLYFTPLITPVELALDAVKIDDHGNELGQVQIVMTGAKLDYLFRPSRIDVSFHPFDGIAFLKPSDHHTKFGVIPGMIQSFPRKDFLFAYYGGVTEIGSNMLFVKLGFSPDLKQWIIRDDENEVSYVVSTDGTYSVQELVEYFNGLT